MIDIHDLVKVFYDFKRGEVRAVDGITLHVPGGCIYGLLGPNGAGKTTTLRILGTVLQPTSGTARVMGHDVETDPVEVRRHIGYVSNNTGIYDRMSPREMMRYFGTLFGMDEAPLNRRIDEIVTMLKMEDFCDTLCGKLSSGQKQKASIARTIIHDPPVLIFDEPTTSLDVLVARDVVEFIQSCKSQDRCVILSTHIMSEAERLCDHLAIIDRGRITVQGEKKTLLPEDGVNQLEDFFFDHIDRTPIERAPLAAQPIGLVAKMKALLGR